MLTEGIMTQIILGPIYVMKGLFIGSCICLGVVCLYGACTEDTEIVKRGRVRKMYRHMDD